MSGYKPKVLLRGYSKTQQAALRALENHFDNKTSLVLTQEACLLYKEIMHEVPYIGHAREGLTTNLILSAQFLPIIMVLEKKGLAATVIGDIISRIGDEYLKTFNPIVLKLARRLYFTSSRLARLRKEAEVSLQRRYDEGWIFDFSNDNLDGAEYKINYYECGIYKFYKKFGYEKYVRYLCEFDFLISEKIGVKLERTKTIGNGDSLCDFKFSKTK